MLLEEHPASRTVCAAGCADSRVRTTHADAAGGVQLVGANGEKRRLLSWAIRNGDGAALRLTETPCAGARGSRSHALRIVFPRELLPIAAIVETDPHAAAREGIGAGVRVVVADVAGDVHVVRAPHPAELEATPGRRAEASLASVRAADIATVADPPSLQALEGIASVCAVGAKMVAFGGVGGRIAILDALSDNLAPVAELKPATLARLWNVVSLGASARGSRAPRPPSVRWRRFRRRGGTPRTRRRPGFSSPRFAPTATSNCGTSPTPPSRSRSSPCSSRRRAAAAAAATAAGTRAAARPDALPEVSGRRTRPVSPMGSQTGGREGGALHGLRRGVPRGVHLRGGRVDEFFRRVVVPQHGGTVPETSRRENLRLRPRREGGAPRDRPARAWRFTARWWAATASPSPWRCPGSRSGRFRRDRSTEGRFRRNPRQRRRRGRQGAEGVAARIAQPRAPVRDARRRRRRARRVGRSRPLRRRRRGRRRRAPPPRRRRSRLRSRDGGGRLRRLASELAVRGVASSTVLTAALDALDQPCPPGDDCARRAAAATRFAAGGDAAPAADAVAAWSLIAPAYADKWRRMRAPLGIASLGGGGGGGDEPWRRVRGGASRGGVVRDEGVGRHGGCGVPGGVHREDAGLRRDGKYRKPGARGEPRARRRRTSRRSRSGVT